MTVTTKPTPTLGGEQGIGLIVAMVVILLFMGVTGAVVPLAVTETAVSANHRRAVVAMYAAEAGLEWVTHELGTVTDWSDVLRGRVTSSLWSSVVQHSGGALLDLGLVTDELNQRLPVASSQRPREGGDSSRMGRLTVWCRPPLRSGYWSLPSGCQMIPTRSTAIR